MTKAEPLRGRGLVLPGAAYGVRAQFRVHRRERLRPPATASGSRNPSTRALALDPEMYDAEFGIGMFVITLRCTGVFRSCSASAAARRRPVEGLRNSNAPPRAAWWSAAKRQSESTSSTSGTNRSGRRPSISFARCRALPENPLFRQIEAEIPTPTSTMRRPASRHRSSCSPSPYRAPRHRPTSPRWSRRSTSRGQRIALKQPARAAAELRQLIAMRPRRRRARWTARSRYGARESDRTLQKSSHRADTMSRRCKCWRSIGV